MNIITILSQIAFATLITLSSINAAQSENTQFYTQAIQLYDDDDKKDEESIRVEAPHNQSNRCCLMITENNADYCFFTMFDNPADLAAIAQTYKAAGIQIKRLCSNPSQNFLKQFSAINICKFLIPILSHMPPLRERDYATLNNIVSQLSKKADFHDAVLPWAAKKGHVNIIKLVYVKEELRPFIDNYQYVHEALKTAAENGDLSIVMFLVEAEYPGIRPHDIDEQIRKSFRNAAYNAASKGHGNIFTFFMNNTKSLEYFNRNDYENMLVIGAKHNEIKIVRYILKLDELITRTAVLNAQQTAESKGHQDIVDLCENWLNPKPKTSCFIS